MRPGLELTPLRLRAIRHGLLLAGLLWLVALVAVQLVAPHLDIHDYWLTPPDRAYQGYTLGSEGQAYTPVWTLAFAPLTALPFPLVYVGWFALNLGLALWLLRPLPRGWLPIGLLLVAPELLTGNVHLLIAASLVLALTGGAWAWVFPIFTKVTPGVGLVWHLARGEWHRLALALGTTGLLAVASWLVAPGLWPAWWATVSANVDSHGPEIGWVPLLPRLPIAVALAVYGARTNRRGLLPVAVLLALPHVFLASLAVLAATPRLVLMPQPCPEQREG